MCLIDPLYFSEKAFTHTVVIGVGVPFFSFFLRLRGGGVDVAVVPYGFPARLRGGFSWCQAWTLRWRCGRCIELAIPHASEGFMDRIHVGARLSDAVLETFYGGVFLVLRLKSVVVSGLGIWERVDVHQFRFLLHAYFFLEFHVVVS